MQPITMSLDKSKILPNSLRFQKDNRPIKCGCNSKNFMLNIRNHSKFVFVSIIHSGILAKNTTSIKFFGKGYFKRVLGIIGFLVKAINGIFLGSKHFVL